MTIQAFGSAPGDKVNILIVEDNKAVSLLISRIVEEAGLGYVIAADGESALRLFSQRDVAMAIIDVELPGIDGFQVGRNIRNNAGVSVPLVFISGNTGDVYKQQSLDAGGDHFLGKPLRPRELQELISSYFPVSETRS